jgi:hypothetical protein
VHDVRHAVPPALHVYAPHAVVGGEAAEHVPLPLHVLEFVWTPAAHVDAVHGVPDVYSSQVRDPLHWPSVPHVDMALAAHSLAGSDPEAIGSQKPSRPAWLQLSHVPLQRDAQHTPSVQKPAAHCASLVHVPPFESRHVPAAHE